MGLTDQSDIRTILCMTPSAMEKPTLLIFTKSLGTFTVGAFLCDLFTVRTDQNAQK